MKSSKLILLLLFFACSLSAQLRLHVAGNAKITGQLDLSSPGSNLFLGTDTGESITTGQFNTFIGLAAGTFNTEGASNTFIGLFSGYSNTSGIENTFIGAGAGLSNLTGRLNTFLGINAGRISTGSYNTFLGAKTGSGNSTGTHNTFIGFEAGSDNNTGGENVFLGSGAGRNNQDGGNNTFIGLNAGFHNRTGENNIAIGRVAGSSGKIGNANTFIGVSAGSFTQLNGEEFYNCTFLGYGADRGAYIDLSNSMALGSQSRISASNSISLGNTSIISIKGQVSFTTFSDSRYKKNIQEDIPGIAFIQRLRPVSYQLDAHGIASFLGEDPKASVPADQQNINAKIETSNQKARDDKSRIRYSGFLAQEVEAAAQKTGFEFSGIDKPQNKSSLYGLRYAEFVVPLVKAVQEQQELIEEQQVEIEELKVDRKHQQQQLTELKSLVEQLLAQQQNHTQSPTYDLTLEQKAMLAQNRPNPFLDHTTIDYFIPGDVQKALIQVTATDGKILGRVTIQETGKGQVNIKTDAYPAGAYFYSLLLDGQVFETKRMVLTK